MLDGVTSSPALAQLPRDGREPLRVTVGGADPVVRQLLADLIADALGIEVGWSECAAAMGPVRWCDGLAVATVEPAAACVGSPVVPVLLRPHLAPRQKEVLIAYTASSELLSVVARRLGMRQETVKTHLRRIRVKYEEVGRPAPTRRDLYVRAVEDELIPSPS